MGRPIAENLLKAGHPVVVHSRSQGPVDELVGAGAKRASSAKDVAAQVDVLITMLPNSPEVELVALGSDGIIEGAKKGLLYLDMSTISPLVSQKVGKALAAKGVRMLDAPVSGGEKGAIDAALSIMVGGEKADFDAALPIFQALGKTITHLGPLGAGGFTKLANQIIVAVNLTALGEALTLARKAGLDRALTLKALGGGLAASKCLEQKTPNYVAGTYNPGFKIDLHFKDLGLIMESSRALGVPLPTTAVVQELFNAMRVRGRGGLDHSGVKDVLEQTFGDYLERQLGTRPRQAFGGAQYVHHRWLMEPWGCFVAEEDNAKIVGAALAVTWGTVGILGPVAVLTNYHNQTIGQQLIRSSQEFFEENKAALHGCVTYPTSPKHLFLFHKFGYRPKALTAVMSRAIDRAPARAAVPKPGKAALAVRRFSSLEETKKKATLARMHRITNAICRGMDLSKEVEIVDGLALGDTLLLERGRDLVGFAIYHTPGVSEAPSGALYVKFLAIDPPQRKVEHLVEFVAALEALGQELRSEERRVGK